MTRTVLIITGDTAQFGSGHRQRMHDVAHALKKHRVTVQSLCTTAEAPVVVPLAWSVCILDRRDTAFNPNLLQMHNYKIAVDNRGQGRDTADLIWDALPHFSMTTDEYKSALQQLMLSPQVTAHAPRASQARVTLHDSAEAAFAAADFKIGAERLSRFDFLAALKNSRRPALYFGQAFFEALYFGLDVQLYPVSEYHKKLSVDLVSRLIIDPNLLAAIDGSGLSRFVRTILAEIKKVEEHE